VHDRVHAYGDLNPDHAVEGYTAPKTTTQPKNEGHSTVNNIDHNAVLAYELLKLDADWQHRYERLQNERDRLHKALRDSVEENQIMVEVFQEAHDELTAFARKGHNGKEEQITPQRPMTDRVVFEKSKESWEKIQQAWDANK